VVLHVEVIPTEELGDRTYVAHDGQTAIVVDPQRDIDRIEALLAANGLTVGAVLETHLHNDYVTGGYELARRTRARYVLNAQDDVAFPRHGVADGDALRVGSMTVQVLATPGHTDTHLSYLVTAGDSAPVVFTGGSLLYGSVGRTDLIDEARTDELTRAQYRSAHRLAKELSDETAIFPTHGFGSFCSSGSAAGGTDSTIGVERGRNDALTESDEDSFVARLIANLTAYPAYYAHMAPANRLGPGAPDLSPAQPVDAEALRKRVAAGEWVVDLRDRTAYAAEHVAGTIGIALGQQFATYLGWLIPWGSPLTLIGESPQQIADAQRQLVRIGIERPAGAALGTAAELAGENELRGYPRVAFADLPGHLTEVDAGPADDAGHRDVLLDVRRDDERATGSIHGSTHVPLHVLLSRLRELPEGRLWVHCATGFRASIAASLLDRAGRDVVLIDDEYATAVASGLATG
jgi:hydroxyacylglutathione hydrolase